MHQGVQWTPSPSVLAGPAPPLSRRAETQSTYLDSLLDSGHTDASASVSSANHRVCLSSVKHVLVNMHRDGETRTKSAGCTVLYIIPNTMAHTTTFAISKTSSSFVTQYNIMRLCRRTSGIVDVWPSGLRRLIPGLCSTGLLAKRIS